ncbi:MAG: DMT family transporter, partial [Nitrospinota bacterium]
MNASWGAAGAVLALLAASLIWGSTFALVKSALADAEEVAFLAWRFAAAVGTLALAAPFALARELRGASPKEWAMGGATGFFLYGGFFFQTEGLRFTSAANSAFITGLCVILVPFILWAGGGRLARVHVLGAGVAVLGLFLLSGADLSASGWGDALTFACAVLFACHIVCLGAFGRRMRTFGLFALQLIAASALAALAARTLGGSIRWSGAVLLALGITGALATTLAFLLQTWAQRRLEPAQAALWLLTEPIFALGFGALLLGERPGVPAMLGAGVILAGLFISVAGGPL